MTRIAEHFGTVIMAPRTLHRAPAQRGGTKDLLPNRQILPAETSLYPRKSLLRLCRAKPAVEPPGCQSHFKHRILVVFGRSCLRATPGLNATLIRKMYWSVTLLGI